MHAHDCTCIDVHIIRFVLLLIFRNQPDKENKISLHDIFKAGIAALSLELIRIILKIASKNGTNCVETARQLLYGLVERYFLAFHGIAVLFRDRFQLDL